jgi:probable phosphoglycerate mutase
LTAQGEKDAQAVGRFLAGKRFGLVLTSPLQRARRTCELAGFGAGAQREDRLQEWYYGACEGRTSAEIQRERPGWTIFRDGPLGGETLDQVAARARGVIERALAADGDVALFGHGHILRILAACWMGVGPVAGEALVLGAAGISVLGYEHETRSILRWNLQAEGDYLT